MKRCFQLACQHVLEHVYKLVYAISIQLYRGLYHTGISHRDRRDNRYMARDIFIRARIAIGTPVTATSLVQ